MNVILTYLATATATDRSAGNQALDTIFPSPPCSYFTRFVFVFMSLAEPISNATNNTDLTEKASVSADNVTATCEAKSPSVESSSIEYAGSSSDSHTPSNDTAKTKHKNLSKLHVY